MKLEDLKVGDRVRIRSWEEMEKEFEVSDDGDIIYCKLKFINEMKHLCGRTAIVKSIDEGYVELADWSDKDGDMLWVFSADMLELVETKETTLFNKKDLRFGMIVELRNGKKCLIHGIRNNGYGNPSDFEGENIYFRNILNAEWETTLDRYSDNLIHVEASNWDIIKVYKNYTLQEVIWERKEVPQLSEEAKNILSLIPKEYKWIAIDKYPDQSVDVGVYDIKPFKSKEARFWWYKNNRKKLSALSYLFEDLDPTQCYLIEDLING